MKRNDALAERRPWHMRTCLSRCAVSFAGFMLVTTASVGAPVLLQCDLKVAKGVPIMCDAGLIDGFCQPALLIDSEARTIQVTVTTKISSSSKMVTIQKWEDDHVVFFERIDVPDKPGVIKENWSHLNRITGAYVDWWEYKNQDGTVISEEDVARRNRLATKPSDFLVPLQRSGQCKPAKPLF